MAGRRAGAAARGAAAARSAAPAAAAACAARRARLPAARLHAVPLASAESPRRRSSGGFTRCTTSISISTAPPALRFHFGELAMAAGFRAAQVLLLGVDRETLRAVAADARAARSSFTTATWNCRSTSSGGWSPFWSRRGCTASITRRARDETDSNFSSLLSWWDRLHRSLRLNVPQASVTIGVPGFSTPEDVTLALADAAVPAGSAATASSSRSSSRTSGGGRARVRNVPIAPASRARRSSRC